MKASPLFEGIRQKWVAQGEQQGLQNAILDALEENLGGYSEDVAEQVREVKDVTVLKKLLRSAVKAKTIAEFAFVLKRLPQELTVCEYQTGGRLFFCRCVAESLVQADSTC
ncbi:hypothetical protein J2Z49_001913 [Desulfofundulus luciae]|uniref:Uncharacterized protein n=1 Tax=Desulfofundulus luciae TaxID=74702 RepID=A0ABU0B253_9FIRM|nr:hypothetical protein [Desulfofundulus luciae]MDQ0286796.1 hypothetical protein [Desulfofundulus luciae]